MILRLLLPVICLQVTLAIAQHETTVWAVDSGSNKLYHCPKSRWYGVGQGQKIGECEALRRGYRPALGNGCGSQCNVNNLW
jgi:hypothetical protein